MVGRMNVGAAIRALVGDGTADAELKVVETSAVARVELRESAAGLARER